MIYIYEEYISNDFPAISGYLQQNTDLPPFTSPDSTIQAGMNNTIIIPSSIFTNSYFYQHEILEGGGATNWPNLTFYGDNA